MCIEAFDVAISVARTVVILAIVLASVPLLVWMDRKSLAHADDDVGQGSWLMNIGLGSVIYTIFDFVRVASNAGLGHRAMLELPSMIAALLAFFVAIASVAAVPFAGPIDIAGQNVQIQVANIDVGLIFAIAMLAVGSRAALMAGSLGAGTKSMSSSIWERTCHISYDLSVALAASAVFIIAQSFGLSDMVMSQGHFPWTWYVVRQPVAFLIFLAWPFAMRRFMSNEMPRDGFASVALMSEYICSFSACVLTATVFLGGWQIPFVSSELLRGNCAEMLVVGGPILGIILVIVGAGRVKGFRRIYCDMRDYERAALGAAMCLAGLALLIASVGLGGFDLPMWLPDAFVALTQAICLVLKAVALYWVAGRMKRAAMAAMAIDRLVNYSLPISAANMAATAALALFVKP